MGNERISNDLLSLLNNLNEHGENETIIRIFDYLYKKLAELRYKNAVRSEREKNTWDDPDMHYKSVFLEEAREFSLEWEDNYTLFKLASFLQHEEIMLFLFKSMVQNLDNIRYRLADKTERSKVSWINPEFHEKEVNFEVALERKKELDDLMKMYNIAKDFEFKQGMEYVVEQLQNRGFSTEELKSNLKK